MDLKAHNTIQLLQPLPKEEIQSLKKFLASPYFNTNKNISQIFEEIVKFHPEFQSKNFTKEFIYKKVFSNKPYSDSNMRWILSEIFHLMERYFAQKHFDKDILIKDYYLSTEYFGTMKIDIVRKALDNAKKNLDATDEKGYIYHLYKYIHYTNELNYQSLFKHDKKAKDLEFYYSTFLKALISYINHSVVGIIYDYLNSEIIVSKYIKNGISKKIQNIMKLLNFEKVSEFIEKDNEDAAELRALTKLLNMFLYPENELLYNEMRKYISENESKLSIGDCASYYSKLIAYCRLKITNSVMQEYYKAELFDITKIFFERKYYKEGRFSHFSPALYRLTLVNMVELGKYDAAEKFIESCKSELAERYRDNGMNYGKALLYFYKKEFDKALEYSSRIEGNFFLTDQKILRIMLFIEKGFYDECAAEIKAFKKFIQTNKFLSPLVRQSLERFLAFIPYLNNSGQKKKMISKKKLKEMLNEKSMVYFKDWMSEKIAGL